MLLTTASLQRAWRRSSERTSRMSAHPSPRQWLAAPRCVLSRNGQFNDGRGLIFTVIQSKGRHCASTSCTHRHQLGVMMAAAAC